MPHSLFSPKRLLISRYSPKEPLPENVCLYLVIGSSVAFFETKFTIPPAAEDSYVAGNPVMPLFGPEIN